MYGKIHSQGTVASVLNSLKSEGKSIVFTNGCFDLLHRGHLEYLATAKKQGDYLVVGINSDASVKRLKGALRPINPIKDRMAMLAALQAIDMVIPFEEDTPIDLIELVKPDVLLKGGDYKKDQIVGAEFVESYKGKVMTIPFISGYSSTELIKKIKNSK